MSEETLFNGIIFVAAVVSAILIFSKSLTMNKRVSKVLREFAAIKGLNPGTTKNPGDILYTGNNRGFPFILEKVTERRKPADDVNLLTQTSTRAGYTMHTFTRMRLTMSGLPAGLSVYRENETRKISTAAGAQDIRTGDPDIDGTFVIKGKNAEEVTRFLTPERLNAFKIHLKGREHFDLRDNGLRYERKNATDSISELSRLYNKMGEFAASFGVTPPAEG